MMDKLELVAKKNKITRTEMIRRILKKELKWYVQTVFGKL
jgi:hypothetical protein